MPSPSRLARMDTVGLGSHGVFSGFLSRDFHRPSLFAGFELQKIPIELASGVRVIWMMGKKKDYRFDFFSRDGAGNVNPLPNHLGLPLARGCIWNLEHYTSIR